jgi:hypothetical protein
VFVVPEIRITNDQARRRFGQGHALFLLPDAIPRGGWNFGSCDRV